VDADVMTMSKGLRLAFNAAIGRTWLRVVVKLSLVSVSYRCCKLEVDEIITISNVA